MPSLFPRLGGTSRRPRITVLKQARVTLRRKTGVQGRHPILSQCGLHPHYPDRTRDRRNPSTAYCPRASMLHLTERRPLFRPFSTRKSHAKDGRGARGSQCDRRHRGRRARVAEHDTRESRIATPERAWGSKGTSPLPRTGSETR